MRVEIKLKIQQKLQVQFTPLIKILKYKDGLSEYMHSRENVCFKVKKEGDCNGKEKLQ